MKDLTSQLYHGVLPPRLSSASFVLSLSPFKPSFILLCNSGSKEKSLRSLRRLFGGTLFQILHIKKPSATITHQVYILLKEIELVFKCSCCIYYNLPIFNNNCIPLSSKICLIANRSYKVKILDFLSCLFLQPLGLMFSGSSAVIIRIRSWGFFMKNCFLQS